MVSVRICFSTTTLALLLASGMSKAALDDSWFNPPGGTWAPGAADVANMKKALDAELPAALAANLDPMKTPVRYWFQFRGRGSGADKEIEIVGYAFPVSERATKAYLDVSTPENCSVSARYSLSVKKIFLAVSGFGCPPRL